jgi:hypothetical protein
MNAAIDQQCEYYIKEKRVEVKSMRFIEQGESALIIKVIYQWK